MVERNLAKVKVAGSSLVSRSKQKTKVWAFSQTFFFEEFLKKNFPLLKDAQVVELVDTQDLKSCATQIAYGFDSRLGHIIKKGFRNLSKAFFSL